MKILKNGDMAFYQKNGMLISLVITGWVVALVITYFAAVKVLDKQVLCLMMCFLGVLAIFMIALEVKMLSRPACIIATQAIRLYIRPFKSVIVPWKQLKVIRGRKSFGQFVFETNRGDVYEISSARMSVEDKRCLLQLFEKHNLTVQER